MSAVASRRKMRKPWEFTWDDAPQKVSEPSSFALSSGVRADESWTGRVEVAPATPVPRRMRKAWDFTWDDAGASAHGAAIAEDVGERSVVHDDVSIAAKAAAGSDIAPRGPADNPASAFPRRRRRNKAVASKARVAAQETPGGLAPAAATIEPAEASNAPAAMSDFEDKADIASVLRRLGALGGGAEQAPRPRAEERVEWVKAGRGSRRVQLVHVGQPKGSSAASPSRLADEPALRSDPLVLRAVRLAELLRSSATEAQGLRELLQAVRDMRDAVAGAEAMAFSRRPANQVPLFFQAYDRRTRTG